MLQKIYANYWCFTAKPTRDSLEVIGFRWGCRRDLQLESARNIRDETGSKQQRGQYPTSCVVVCIVLDMDWWSLFGGVPTRLYIVLGYRVIQKF
jgi:hypothetical protein